MDKKAFSLAILFILALFLGAIVARIIEATPSTDQSAVCAVLQKHIPNRSPQVVGGECGMLVGVDEPRVWMSVEDYGKLIMEDEK